ncbi:MAG: hypothetical protein ABSC55_01945 [Syntrophorhabdales bacterium]
MPEFITDDVYLAGTISIILQREPSLRTEGNGRVVFSYPQSDSLDKAIVAYSQGATVPAIELCQALRRLRSRMYATRGLNKGRL